MKQSSILIILLFLSIILSNISCKKDKNEQSAKLYFIYPENNSVVDTVPQKLDWYCTANDTNSLTYDLYFGTNNSPELLASGINISEYSNIEVASEQTYYWRVIAKDDYGNITEGDIWSFSTGNLPPETPAN